MVSMSPILVISAEPAITVWIAGGDPWVTWILTFRPFFLKWPPVSASSSGDIEMLAAGMMLRKVTSASPPPPLPAPAESSPHADSIVAPTPRATAPRKPRRVGRANGLPRASCAELVMRRLLCMSLDITQCPPVDYGQDAYVESRGDRPLPNLVVRHPNDCARIGRVTDVICVTTSRQRFIWTSPSSARRFSRPADGHAPSRHAPQTHPDRWPGAGIPVPDRTGLCEFGSAAVASPRLPPRGRRLGSGRHGGRRGGPGPPVGPVHPIGPRPRSPPGAWVPASPGPPDRPNDSVRPAGPPPHRPDGQRGAGSTGPTGGSTGRRTTTRADSAAEACPDAVIGRVDQVNRDRSEL
jgi:hypothetical protein